MTVHSGFAGNRRLRLIVGQTHVVMVLGAQINMLTGVKRFNSGNKAQVKRIGIGDFMLGECLLPPF